jgi:hypothetical protein
MLAHLRLRLKDDKLTAGEKKDIEDKHLELKEWAAYFPEYPDEISKISEPRPPIPPAELNKTSLATEWAIKAPRHLGDSSLPTEYKCHWRVFSEELSHRFPPAWLDDHEIKLKEGAPSTIKSKTYPLSQAETEAARKWIEENEHLGYIEKGDSPWATPFFFVKKQDGTLCPVQDYCKVNKWTIPDVYPLPRIETILEQLEGKQLFTTLDICWGYNNIRIKVEDRWKVAFITPFGLYLPNVMPFGLRNAPGTFQRCMHTVF